MTNQRSWMEWAEEAALLALLFLSCWRFAPRGGPGWGTSATLLVVVTGALVLHFVLGLRPAPLPAGVVAVAVAFVAANSDALGITWTVPGLGGHIVGPSVPLLIVIAATWALDSSQASSLERALVLTAAALVIFTTLTTLMLLRRDLVDPRVNVSELGRLLMLVLLLRGVMAAGRNPLAFRRLSFCIAIVLILGLVRGQV